MRGGWCFSGCLRGTTHRGGGGCWGCLAVRHFHIVSFRRTGEEESVKGKSAICKVFVGLENVILRMLFVILFVFARSPFIFAWTLSLFLTLFVLLRCVCVFFRCFACRMMLLHRIIPYQKNCVVIIRWSCMSYDALASDNCYQKNWVVIVRSPCMLYDALASDHSYQKNCVVIVRSPCMSYDALASDNSYQKNCVVILRSGNQFLSGLSRDPKVLAVWPWCFQLLIFLSSGYLIP